MRQYKIHREGIPTIGVVILFALMTTPILIALIATW